MTTKELILEQLRKQKDAVSDEDLQSRKREWLDSLTQLFSTLSEWTREAEAEGLLSRETYDVEIHEEHLGTYSAPALRLKAPSGGTVEIRPRATFITGGDGRVDWEGSAGREATLIRTDAKEWVFAELQASGRWYFRPLNEEYFWEIVGYLLD